MLNNYPKYYFSMTYPSAQNKLSTKGYVLGPYSGVNP